MGPGPSPVSLRVRQAMARPLLGHLDPRFLAELDRLQDDLRHAFGSSSQLTFPVSGTGSAAMETAVVNLIWPGRRVLVLQNGVFGTRLAEMARRVGGDVRVAEFAFGSPVDPERARREMAEFSPHVVAVVQAETSTGALSDIDALAPIVAEQGAKLIVDAVTSLGSVPVRMDAWGAAAVYSGSQKCLGAPPGLGPISLADGVLEERPQEQRLPTWYLDVGLIARYLGTERVYHHTAPVSMIFALAEALRVVREEGLAQRQRRHRQAGAAMRAGLGAIGLHSRVAPGSELPSLSVVQTPEGLDEAALRKELLQVEDIEIAGGLGPWAGAAWRVGTMGEGANLAPVLRTIAGIARVLTRAGRRADAVAAAEAARGAWQSQE